MKMQVTVIFVTGIENKYVKNKKYHEVRHHCYFTGEYRVAAHSICSFKYSVPKKFL